MNSEQAGGVLLIMNPESRSINARRNSTGEVATRASSVSKSQGKVTRPHLRPSTGSCHDFCKYGKKHAFESKASSPTFPWYSNSGTSSGRAQNHVPSLREKQKKTALKQQIAADPEICLHDCPNVSDGRFSSSMKTVKRIQESETRNHESICNEKSVSSKSVIKCNLPSTSKQSSPLKAKTIKQGTVQKIGSCYHTKATAGQSPISLKKAEASASSDTMKLAPHEVNLSTEKASAEQRNLPMKMIFSTKPKVEQKAPSLVKKTISAVKPKTSPANRSDVSAKPALPGRSNVTSVKPGSQQKTATQVTGRKFGTMIVKNINVSEPHGKRNLKSPSESTSPQSPPNHVSKSTSPLKHAKKFEDNTTGHEEQEYPESESVSSGPCDLVSDDGGDMKKIAAHNEDKKSDEKLEIVQQKYKDQNPYQFRREKILEPSSNDGDTRLLRFRQGRRITRSQGGEGEFEKMNFKSKELTFGETDQSDPEGQAVVLRHQDVQDKKEIMSLLNNVIEETASKLVEMRKSKVKALVGAFETVISLQERRPTAPV